MLANRTTRTLSTSLVASIMQEMAPRALDWENLLIRERVSPTGTWVEQ